MFERFTERARQAIVLAQDEARALGHAAIGTEHILLGVLREEEGLGAHVLGSVGITIEDARQHIVRLKGSGDEVTPGQIPFTPRAKKALDSSLREALSLGHNYIGTEHILLGVVDADDVAGRTLRDLGADAETIRNQIVTLLSGPAERERARPLPPDVPHELEEIRRLKEEAIESQQFELAAELRERERKLVQQTREERFRDESYAYVPSQRRGIAGILFAVALGFGILVGWGIWGH